MGKRPVVAVVGPSTAGKSTLVDALCERGFTAHHVAQEHSYVPNMWQHIVGPDVLVYLDVSYEVACRRRPATWGPERLEVEGKRLRHARAHCDLYVDTDPLTPEAILEQVLSFLRDEWD
jgi:nicotinamide riboside kinase